MLTPDSIGPAMGGGVVAAGVPRRHLVPDHRHGFLHDLAQYLPSYWLVQASHVAVGGRAWAAHGVDRDGAADGRAQGALAMWAYGRDTQAGVGSRIRRGRASFRNTNGPVTWK